MGQVFSPSATTGISSASSARCSPPTNPCGYAGNELDLFAAAGNWKAYLKSVIGPAVRGDVLEVGAGIGGTTRALCSATATSWVCLEPDPRLAARIRAAARSSQYPRPVEVVEATLADLDPARRFDTILYIDVLEHIKDDARELRSAAARLRPGGTLVVLCPAFQGLYSRFDRAIGHHRRYTTTTLRAACPDGLTPVRLIYLDSLGALLSLGNRWLLRAESPSPAQVTAWDRGVVPLSRVIDPLIGRSVGRSVLGIWVKPG